MQRGGSRGAGRRMMGQTDDEAGPEGCREGVSDR